MNHGIDSATYLLAPSFASESGVAYRPHVACQCGEAFIGDSWADVGEMFDEHLTATDTNGADE